MEFCDILKILRKKKHLTQSDLAERVSIGQPIVSDWESGEKYPQFDTLIKLSEIFNISLDELMGKKENTLISSFYKIEQLSKIGKLTLEELRKEYNLTVDELAKMLGISRNTLINWEKNGLPNLDIYKKIFQYFDLSIDQIFELK